MSYNKGEIMIDDDYIELALRRVQKYKKGTIFSFENIFSNDEWKEIKKHGQASLRFAEHAEEKEIAKRLDNFVVSSHKNSVRLYEKL